MLLFCLSILSLLLCIVAIGCYFIHLYKYKSLYIYYENSTKAWIDLYTKGRNNYLKVFDQCATLKKVNIEVNDALAEERELNASLGMEIKSLEIDQRHLQTSISKYKASIISLKKQLKDKTLTDLNVKELENENSNLQVIIADLRSKNDQLSQKIDELTNQLYEKSNVSNHDSN